MLEYSSFAHDLNLGSNHHGWLRYLSCFKAVSFFYYSVSLSLYFSYTHSRTFIHALQSCIKSNLSHSLSSFLTHSLSFFRTHSLSHSLSLTIFNSNSFSAVPLLFSFPAIHLSKIHFSYSSTTLFTFVILNKNYVRTRCITDCKQEQTDTGLGRLRKVNTILKLIFSGHIK